MIMAKKGQIMLGHKRFLIFAAARGAKYAGKPSNTALREIMSDLNKIGQTIPGYRSMRVHQSMRYWLPYAKNPVTPKIYYRQALQRLTKGSICEIHVDDWNKVVEIIDSSPWLPGQM
jgi:hypothetical protein